jgi:hypothetical protein
MSLFDAGTTFLVKRSTNLQGTKPKYFIGMNNGDEEDECIISFVFNTEKRMDLHHLHCNKDKQKFIIEPSTFSFINVYSAIILSVPNFFSLKEILCEKEIKIMDTAPELLSRQIKNCIDWSYIPIKYHQIIKQCFK